jgi:hypothetical protein
MTQAREETINQRLLPVGGGPKFSRIWLEAQGFSPAKRIAANQGFSPGPSLYGLVELKIAVTGPGSSLSAFFNNRLTCHISVLERTCE